MARKGLNEAEYQAEFQEWRKKLMMKTRIITGAIITAICIAVICFSHMPWVLSLTCALLSVQAIRELHNATGMKNKTVRIISIWGAVIFSFVKVPFYENIIQVLFICALLMFGYCAENLEDMTHIGTEICSVLTVMIVFFFRGICDIRAFDNGLCFLILAFAVSIITDIAAFLIGRKLGKHKLCPILSPNKTVEGSIGGGVCAIILIVGVVGVIDITCDVSVNYALLIAYLILASVIGQIGDLASSAVKRIAGIKDYGNILPGHGGILDRFDSLLFVLPFTYLFFR